MTEPLDAIWILVFEYPGNFFARSFDSASEALNVMLRYKWSKLIELYCVDESLFFTCECLKNCEKERKEKPIETLLVDPFVISTAFAHFVSTKVLHDIKLSSNMPELSLGPSALETSLTESFENELKL